MTIPCTIDGINNGPIDREIDRTALQAHDKNIIIATGRTFMAAQHYLIGKIEPDGHVCTNGADILEHKALESLHITSLQKQYRF